MCSLHHCKNKPSLSLSYEVYDTATNKKNFDYCFEICDDCLEKGWEGDERSLENYLEETAEVCGYYAVLKSSIRINVGFGEFLKEIMWGSERSMKSIDFSISLLFPYLIFPPLFTLLPFFTLLLLLPQLKESY